MALRYANGFEGVRDDNDWRAMGWITPSTQVGAHTVCGVPSITGISGTSIKVMGPYAATALRLPNQGATYQDPGMFDTGYTVNQLWAAGGFAFGFYGYFNSGTQNQIAAVQPNQVVYDGSQYYWAIMLTGTGTYNVAYSTDAVHWTATVAAPNATSLASNSTLCVIGSGPTATVYVNNNTNNSASSWGSYTTNLGTSWTTPTVPPVSGNWNLGGCASTGNSSFPLVFGADIATTAGGVYVYASGLTGSPIQVVTGPGTAISYAIKYVPNAACTVALGSTGTINVGAASASLGTSAGWPAATTLSGVRDMTYFNGVWIAATSAGISTAPPASTGPVTGPSSSATWTAQLSAAAGIRAVTANSVIAVAVGYDPTTTSLGAIWTSTNGTTWTKSNRLLRYATAATGFSNVIWDGTRFLIFGGSSNNIIAQSTDGFQWNPIYYPDYTETVESSSGSITGLYLGTLASGVYSAPTGSTTSTNMLFVIEAGALSSGNRVVQALVGQYGASNTVNSFTSLGSTTINTSTNPGNYYELIFIPTATANTFIVSFSVNGTVISTSATGYLLTASTTDTTSHVLINLGRAGTFTAFDDMSFSDYSGTVFNKNLGPINMVVNTPVSDVQAQWTRGGSQASNAAAVGLNSFTNASNVAGYNVSTFTTGAKDIYNMSATIPTNFTGRALLVEGYFERSGGSVAPTVTVGAVSGSAEVDSANVSVPNTSTPTYAYLLVPTDPNTGAAWASNSALTSAKVSITKTS